MSKRITTKINSDIILTEPVGGIRFGTDALLLADFAFGGVKKGNCLDIGTGSGVIPLLLLALGSKSNFTGVEIQKDFSDAAAENSAVNGFSGRFCVINADISSYRSLFKPNSFESVVTNPPYMKKNCGDANGSYALSVARREELGGIELFCEAAAWCLGTGGRFFAVYRADRAVTLISAMRNNRIEPKRIKFIRPYADAKPRLVLAEGIKDGGEGVLIEPDLVLYSDRENTESDTLKAIYSRFDGGKG